MGTEVRVGIYAVTVLRVCAITCNYIHGGDQTQHNGFRHKSHNFVSYGLHFEHRFEER